MQKQICMISPEIFLDKVHSKSVRRDPPAVLVKENEEWKEKMVALSMNQGGGQRGKSKPADGGPANRGNAQRASQSSITNTVS